MPIATVGAPGARGLSGGLARCKQGTKEWDKEETEGPGHSLTFPSLCSFDPHSMGRFRRRVPESQPPPHPTPLSPQAFPPQDSGVSPLGVSDISPL